MQLAQIRGVEDSLVGPFCKDLVAMGKATTTVACYRYDVEQFLRLLGSKSAGRSAVCLAAAREFPEFRAVLVKHAKPITANRKLSALKAFFKWAARSGLIDQRSIPDLRHVAQQQRKDNKARFLTKAEQIKLLKAAKNEEESHAFALLSLMLSTGIRTSEICSLRWKDIEVRDRECTVSIKSAKSGRDVFYNVQGSAFDELTKLRTVAKNETDGPVFGGRFGPLTRQSIRTVLERCSFAAGLEIATPNVLRATFEANCVREGADPYMIAYLMGYSRLRLPQQRYIKLREAVAKRELMEIPQLKVEGCSFLRTTARKGDKG
jgi:integrase/recombinase XerD